jgi:hypothetical protein
MGDWSALNRLGPVAVAAIHLRAELRCAYCAGWTLLGHRQVDHVVPRADGGEDVPENLVLACRRCNCGRDGADILPLRARLAGRTRAQVRASIRCQTAIPIGPGSALHATAIERAWLWWPDQMLRRMRAREAHRVRECMSFFDGVAA